MNTFVFELPYEPGQLTAVALDGGEEQERTSLVTSGKPARLHLGAERREIKADRGEIAYIRIEVRDELDRLVPDASLPVAITVRGPAELIAAGNADPAGMESVKDPDCLTFRGRALCIIRSYGSAGTITVSAASPGLTDGSTGIVAGN
jgi:beta-galactosidase